MSLPKNVPVFESLPPELCRFRTFGSPIANGGDEAAVYELLQGRLRFTDITTFNDPFEGRPRHVAAYEDAGRQREEMLRYLASIAPVNGSNTERRRWAESLIRGKTMQELIDMIDVGLSKVERQGEFFLLCLMDPKVVTTPLPWSHYADSHRGVCVHFDSSMLPIRLAFPVEYGSEYPTMLVPRTAQPEWDGIRNTLLRKCDLWSYEQEYRVMRLNLPDAGVSQHLFVAWQGDVAIASPHVVKAITLGCRLEDGPRDRLVAWIHENAPHVEVWKAKLHRSRYELERERIA